MAKQITEAQRAAMNAAEAAFARTMLPHNTKYNRDVAPLREAFDRAWIAAGYPTDEKLWPAELQAACEALGRAKTLASNDWNRAWRTTYSEYQRAVGSALSAIARGE
jgi:hypothetical protein